jgi:uncharacterized membrane protein YfcA
VAGGGSLISFPALVATGMPALHANVTNQIAVLPGYLGASLAYRDELSDQRSRAVALGVAARAVTLRAPRLSSGRPQRPSPAAGP